MKKITKFVLVALLGIILVISSCVPEDLLPCTIICPAPSTVGVGFAEEVVDPNGFPVVMTSFVWDPVLEANSYTLNIYLDGVLFESVNTGADPAYEANLGNLAIDTQIEAEVASNCDCGQSLFSPLFLAIYKNGGGTLDIVLNNSTREIICQSTCEYLQFPNINFNKCDNTILDLSRSNSGYIFFEKTQLCSCLNAYTDPCVAISNLRVCLDSLDRAVKTSGEPCP
ncbi:MAG: hypothetical protein ACI94Y_002533 [Maribacter sp.]|jgi:hypothetical protein